MTHALTTAQAAAVDTCSATGGRRERGDQQPVMPAIETSDRAGRVRLSCTRRCNSSPWSGPTRAEEQVATSERDCEHADATGTASTTSVAP